MKKYKSSSKYLFKVLWSKTDIGIAINEIHQATIDVPLTSFYFWPREDGWKLLKAELDSKPWMEEDSKIEILNGYTLIINSWLQNSNKNLSIIKPYTENININVDVLAIHSIN